MLRFSFLILVADVNILRIIYLSTMYIVLDIIRLSIQIYTRENCTPISDILGISYTNFSANDYSTIQKCITRNI